MHSDITEQEDSDHTVSYLGVLQQALRDLSKWVENGVPPPASTNYNVIDGQVVVGETAAERRVIQPVAELSVDGKKVTGVKKLIRK